MSAPLESVPVSPDGGATRIFGLNASTQSWSINTIQHLDPDKMNGSIVRLSADGTKMIRFDPYLQGPNIFTYVYDESGSIWNHVGAPITGNALDIDLAGQGHRFIRGGETETIVYEFNESSGNWEQLGNAIGKRGDIVSLSDAGNRGIVYDTLFNTINTIELNPENSTWTLSSSTISPNIEQGFAGFVEISPDGNRWAYAAINFSTGDKGVWISDFSDFFVELGGITLDNSSSGASFAFSSDGNRIAVAEKGVQQTRVFQYDQPNNSWTQVNETVAFSGGEVAISGYGSIVAIGDPSYMDNQGKVKVYNFDESNSCNIGNSVHGLDFTEIPFEADYLLGVKFTLEQEGTLHSINMIGNNTGSNFQMAVYDDNGGVPNDLVASTGTGIVGAGIVSLPVSPVVLPAGDYWIMAVYENLGNHSFVNQSASNSVVYYGVLAFGSPIPSNASGFISYTGNDFLYFLDITCETTVSTKDLKPVDDKIAIYPNPSSDYIQFSGMATKERYALYNALGNKISDGMVENGETLDVRSFERGLYLFKFENGSIVKFLKQ